MNKQNITIIILIILVFILGYCNYIKPIKTIKPDERKIENTIRYKTIYDYKDSIIYKDSILYIYLHIKDSISKMNKNSLEEHYDGRIDSLNTNKDTLIDNLVYEIEISDTLIKDLNKTIEYRDTIIHNLEILSDNFESMLGECEKELVKANKKIKRKNIWIAISTTVTTVLTIILIAS